MEQGENKMQKQTVNDKRDETHKMVSLKIHDLGSLKGTLRRKDIYDDIKL